MLARPRALSIITTRRCTAACDHCCVGASPRATGAIPVPRIHALLDEAKRVPSIELIGFTGGECFLLGRDLDALIAHAHELELRTRVVTNGYWAIDERAAHARVRTLRTAGLDEMMISTGTFHQRFVPVLRIVHAARAAAAAGILTRVAIEDCDQQTFDDALLREELAEQIAGGRVHLGRDPWITDAGGRGAAALSHTRLLERTENAGVRGRCTQVLDVITVTPDQHLVGCCGYPLEELPALRIGSVSERPLDAVLTESPNELLKMWLHVAGPSGIADFVARKLPGFALPAGASICQACIALQRNGDAMRVIAEHAVEVVQAVASAFLELQSGRDPLKSHPTRSSGVHR